MAAGVARALLMFYSRHRHRFEDIIADNQRAQIVSLRPHVRFDGDRLEEISSESWPHAQNDALGYFLWLYASLARAGHVALDESALDVLGLFLRYLEAIRFWQDEDSGHWEETRKISASSIGTVTAGLEAVAAPFVIGPIWSGRRPLLLRPRGRSRISFRMGEPRWPKSCRRNARSFRPTRIAVMTRR